MKREDKPNSYSFLKEQLYDRPEFYEAGFRVIRGYAVSFRNFADIRHLTAFAGARDESVRLRLKSDLAALDRLQPWLRPRIVEIMMFLLWEDLVRQYGTGETFSESYWDLMMELEDNFITKNTKTTE